MKNNKKQIVAELADKLNEYYSNRETKDQYVVGYYDVRTDELIGYHQSTFCQLTRELLEGKRYSGDNPYNQLSTISKNLRGVLESTPENPGFGGLLNLTREQYFEEYSIDDIRLDAIYLSDGMEPRRITFTYIENDGENDR